MFYVLLFIIKKEVSEDVSVLGLLFYKKKKEV